MYLEDQSRIASWAMRTSHNTRDVGTFVLLTIQQQFSGVGNALNKVRMGDMTPLWGHKRAGYEYLKEKQLYLHNRFIAALDGRIWINDLMRDYLAVPGLGLVKAGFTVQLLAGEAGCMDMHNLERFGLDEAEFTIPKRKDPDAQLRVINESIEHYMYRCEQFGGSAALWDGWCAHVAEKYSVYQDADDVSRRHVKFLTGERE